MTTAKQNGSTNTANVLAAFQAVGSGRMTVTEEAGCYTFRITGRTNTLIISDDEATVLAETILERNQGPRP